MLCQQGVLFKSTWHCVCMLLHFSLTFTSGFFLLLLVLLLCPLWFVVTVLIKHWKPAAALCFCIHWCDMFRKYKHVCKHGNSLVCELIYVVCIKSSYGCLQYSVCYSNISLMMLISFTSNCLESQIYSKLSWTNWKLCSTWPPIEVSCTMIAVNCPVVRDT